MASNQNGTARILRRYGPFGLIVVVVVIIALVVVVFGGSDDEDSSSSSDEVPSEEELIRTGPMTPAKAEQEGVDNVDFGPNCDTDLGTVAIPTVYAPPCVEPFTGDNGGATSPGVTADSIKIVRYNADPALDPLLASQISSAGADVDPESATITAQGYIDLYSEYFELYGRTIDFESYTGTGASDDEQAAKADAIAISEKDPFAVIGGPTQATRVFADELAARGILCIGNCALAIPEEFSKERRPYIWNAGPTPNEAARLAAEMIGKLAPPGPAEFAGDPELQQQDRVYGIAHYDTPDGSQKGVFELQKDELAKYDIKPKTDAEFFLDLARAQENARTIITKFKDAGVTTIIYTGDPITPSSLTAEATAQDYFPEWILGQSVLADIAVFGRLNDGEQWKNGFGISLPAGRAEEETTNSYRLYQWFNGEPPPNNTYGVINPEVSYVMRCIHLAGPELTPETCRDGFYRIPPSGGGPTNPLTSWGDHGFWPGVVDVGAGDDGTIIWWDPTAEGENEIGQNGLGLYRYANGGQRYKLGDIPSREESGLFDVANSVTIYAERPPEDTPPDYPSPAGG
jgi:hypothetical protein